MLTFYPEFDADFDPQQEVVYLIDMSNSMKGQSARDAKKVLVYLIDMSNSMKGQSARDAKKVLVYL